MILRDPRDGFFPSQTQGLKKGLDPGYATLLNSIDYFTCAAEAIVAASAATAVQGGELVNELYQRVRHRGQGFPCLQTAVSAHKKRTF